MKNEQNPSPSPSPRPIPSQSADQQLAAIRQSAKAADLSTSTLQNQFDWIAVLMVDVAEAVEFPVDKNVTGLPAWVGLLKTRPSPTTQTPKRQLELIKQCAAISPGNILNQVDGAVMLALATARALKQPGDEHLRELVVWAESVVKALP